MNQLEVTLKDLNDEKKRLGCNKVGTTAAYIIREMFLRNALNNITNVKYNSIKKDR